jgi:hypothetical protein
MTIRFRWLLALALLSPVAATAQWWDPRVPMPRAQVTGFDYVYQRSDINRASFEFQRGLHAGDIEKLERMHEEFLRLEKAGRNGRWMLEAISRGLEIGMPVALKDRQKLLALLARWKKERPQSALRTVTEANAWFASGWEHRGTGFANTVSPEAMRLFRQDVERAAAALREGGVEAATTPLYYRAAIAIAGSSGRGHEVMDAIYREGIAKFPIDYPIADARRNYLMPQWGGSHEALDRFIRDAVKRTQHTDGTAVYARLYMAVARNVDQRDFFGSTKADWRLMRHAFEDAIALENDSLTLNGYATFACMAGDRETLRRVLVRLGSSADLGLGLEFVSPDACVEMARGER